jgi:hypothetical protein
MVVLMVAAMVAANRDEYREAAAEADGNEQAGNNFFHHLSPFVGQ